MKLLIDMNLSPDWCDVFQNQGWHAMHWSTVGDPRATEADLMAWARTQGYVVFTHDLDFGSILAATRATGPSVIQVRTQDVLPARLAKLVIPVLQQHQVDLAASALIVLDEAHARVRTLPLSGKPDP